MTDNKPSPESIQRVADALTGTSVDREINAMTEKEQAIIRAEEIVYAEVSRWVGFKVEVGGPIPIMRGGKQVGSEPNTLLGDNLAKRVAQAARTDDKAELQRKAALYEEISDASRTALNALISARISDRVSLEMSAREIRSGTNNPTDIETRILREIGVVSSSLVALLDLLVASKALQERAEVRLSKLKSRRGRSRNEAAYAVALELARLYAKVMGKKPTYAEGADGLSGEYTPALRNVFDALGWEKTALRGPAEAARDAITEGDMEYAVNRLLGLFPAWGTK